MKPVKSSDKPLRFTLGCCCGEKTPGITLVITIGLRFGIKGEWIEYGEAYGP